MTDLKPECYVRHTEIDNHIKESKFWRGVIISVVIAGTAILIGQYNMSIENNSKITALTSKLTIIAETNVKRLDRLEDAVLWFKGQKGEKGYTGLQGDKGEKGDTGK